MTHVIVVTPRIARDLRTGGIGAVGGVRVRGVVDGAERDDRARGRQHVADVGPAIGGAMQVVHSAGIAAIQPLAEEAQLDMVGGRRDAAEVEPRGGCFTLDLGSGD